MSEKLPFIKEEYNSLAAQDINSFAYFFSAKKIPKNSGDPCRQIFRRKRFPTAKNSRPHLFSVDKTEMK
ncbi:MAG: hypothetical protein RR716_00835 [Christensenellaceae bacterium]